MKKPKQLRLSQEAIDELEKQPNQSQYVEDLILGRGSQQAPWLDLQYEMEKQADRIINDILYERKAHTQKPSGEVAVPDCCKKKTPCKHWAFNGENWVNSLSGEIRETA